MKLYDNAGVDRFVDRYIERGGELIVIHEGTLACYGLAILYCEYLKTFIIKEKYLNCWSSVNTVRSYNVMPKKYRQLINEY